MDSILFAINIDQEELNSIKSAKGLDDLMSPTGGGSMDPVLHAKWEDYRPVIGGDDSQGKKYMLVERFCLVYNAFESPVIQPCFVEYMF